MCSFPCFFILISSVGLQFLIAAEKERDKIALTAAAFAALSKRASIRPWRVGPKNHPRLPDTTRP